MADDAVSQVIDFRFQGLSDANRQLEQTIALVKKLDDALQQLHQKQGSVQAQMGAASPSQQPQLQQQIEKLNRAVEDVFQQRSAAVAQASTYQSQAASHGTLRPLQAPTSNAGASSGGPTGPTATPPQGPQPSPPHTAPGAGGGPTPPNVPPPSAPAPPAAPGPGASPGLWQRLMSGAGGLGHTVRENLFSQEGAINLGFSLMFGAQSVAGVLTPGLSGQRVTPEAQQRGMAGLLPFAGGIVGTAFGGFGGQMIGSGAGQIAQELFDARSERDEKVRVASEEMAGSLGLSSRAAASFASTIEAAAAKLGTPVVELANTLTSLSRSTTSFSMRGASEQQAFLQSQLGDAYSSTMGSVLKYAQTAPLSSDFERHLGQGALTSDDLMAAAAYAAGNGDIGQVQDLLRTRKALGTQGQEADLTADLNRMRNYKGTALGFLPGLVPFSNVNRRIRSDEAALGNLQSQDQQNDTSPEAQALLNALEQNRTQQQYAAGFGLQAGTAATGAATALTLGRGAAGSAPYVAQELVKLQGEQDALRQSRDTLVSLGQYDKTPEQQAQRRLQIYGVDAQLADASQRLAGASTGQFRQGLSESEAAYQGAVSRLGTRGSVLSLSGVSVDDARSQAVFGGESRAMIAEANRLSALALGDNSLRPEEREQYRSQAAQLRLQAGVGQRNEIFNLQQSEQASEQGLRGSRVGLQMATAQATGTVGDVVAAQQAALAENLRKQNEAQQDLATMAQQGIGTYQQRLQIETQLKNLQAEEVTLQQQFRDQIYTAVTNETRAAAGAGAALSRRMTFGGGTTARSFSASSASITAESGYVAELKQRAEDPTLDPKTRWQRQQEYQEAASRLDTDVAGQYGSYLEDVGSRRRRQSLEGMSRRMSLSPMEPGNRLGVDAALNALDATKLKGIGGQRARILADFRAGTITADQRDNALLSLEGQEEDTRTGMAQRSASFASQMFSDQISMSVGSPSFASRLMPSPMDAAAIAERRGLGPVSARVFGYTRAETYGQTMAYGMPPPDQDLMMFGRRPGDTDAVQIAGRGGPALGGDAGSAAALGTQLKDLTAAISALAQHGFRVDVVQTNPDTGQRSAHTVNAIRNGDTSALQRGGASDTGRGRY